MRRLLLTAAVSLLIISAGCSSVLSDQTTEFDATPASVNEETAESIGYQGGNTTTETLERNVSLAGQNRTIKATNHITQYKRSATTTRDGANISIPGAARFMIISMPGAKTAGQTLNPVADWSNKRIAEEVTDRTNLIQDVEYVGNRTTEALGEPREVSMFTGTITASGEEYDVRIHFTSFEHEGEVLIAGGAHTVLIEEEKNIDEMMGSIEHRVREDGGE
jgi:hypothetical protein